jgi:hypothetical protein
MKGTPTEPRINWFMTFCFVLILVAFFMVVLPWILQ